MTALATALQRVWSAKGRLPRLTGRGMPAGFHGANDLARPGTDWFYKLMELVALARRTAPTVVIIALRIFR
jgi:hypothetical protein